MAARLVELLLLLAIIKKTGSRGVILLEDYMLKHKSYKQYLDNASSIDFEAIEILIQT